MLEEYVGGWGWLVGGGAYYYYYCYYYYYDCRLT